MYEGITVNPATAFTRAEDKKLREEEYDRFVGDGFPEIATDNDLDTFFEGKNLAQLIDTTTSDGSAKWRKEFAKILKGREIQEKQRVKVELGEIGKGSTTTKKQEKGKSKGKGKGKSTHAGKSAMSFQESMTMVTNILRV